MLKLCRGYWFVAIALFMLSVSVVACTARTPTQTLTQVQTTTPTSTSIQVTILTPTTTVTEVPTTTSTPTSTQAPTTTPTTTSTPTATSTPLPPSVTAGIDAPANVPAGSDFVATVNITQVTDFNAYTFLLTYDPAIIQVKGAEGGSGVTPGLIGTITVPIDAWVFQPPRTPSGKIKVLGHLARAAGATGSGYLVQINFHVAGTVGQKSDIVISELELFNNVGEPITATTPVFYTVQVTASP